MADKTAPGELELVQDFVNTHNVEDLDDEFAQDEAFQSRAALHDWLAERDLLESKAVPDDDDVRHAIELREALCLLLLANNGGEENPRAAATVDEAARRAGLALRFRPDGSAGLEPSAGGVDGAMGRLLAIVGTAMGDGTWSRLKACPNDTCLWAFYDRSKNRSGRWCTMDVCGNRMKARTYRARHA